MMGNLHVLLLELAIFLLIASCLVLNLVAENRVHFQIAVKDSSQMLICMYQVIHWI